MTGFDDMPVAQHLKPSLTTLRQPVWEVGRTLIHLLIALLREEQPAAQHILLPPELVVREFEPGVFPGDSRRMTRHHKINETKGEGERSDGMASGTS